MSYDDDATVLKDAASIHETTKPHSGEIDLGLLEDSLAKSPWERMLANDDALNFAETLRLAMERQRAEP